MPRIKQRRRVQTLHRLVVASSLLDVVVTPGAAFCATASWTSSSSSTDATPLPGLTNVSTALLLGELVDLLARMMSWEADKRPTAAEALKHPFFGLAHEMSLL